MKALKIKICGINQNSSYDKIKQLSPDFIGHIFYKNSARNVADTYRIEKTDDINPVGVFVNENMEQLLLKCEQHQLKYVQLHGNEKPEFCKMIQENGLKIIKAFSISSVFDFNLLHQYEKHCDYFLFDAKGENYGGNGIRFRWRLLRKYELSKPYFLSGGISSQHADEILDLSHSDNRLYGIDLNSGFEISPAIKDEKKLMEFIKNIKKENYGIASN